LTPDSASSIISIQLNFFPISNADSSFDTIMISLIDFVSEITCKISFSIISHKYLMSDCGRFNLDLDLEKDLIGITTEVFKLLFNLF